MEQNTGAERVGRTTGSAVGVFFISWLLEAVGANAAFALMYGTFGVGGSLLGSIIIAVLWKNGTFDKHGGAGAMVVTSLIVGAVCGLVVAYALPSVYQMRYGG